MTTPIQPGPGSTGLNTQAASGFNAANAGDKSRRLTEIRDQIKNGTYTVNFEKLASSLLKAGEITRP